MGWQQILENIKALAGVSTQPVQPFNPEAQLKSDPEHDKKLAEVGADGAVFNPILGKKYGAVKTPQALADPQRRDTVAKHEVVHMGQEKYGPESLPTYEETDKHVFNQPGATKAFMDQFYGEPPIDGRMEFGATVTQPKPMPGYIAPWVQPVAPKAHWPSKDQVFNYFDLLYKKNPRQAGATDAYMPQRLMRDYVKVRPRPIVSPVHQKIMDRGNYDALFGR